MPKHGILIIDMLNDLLIQMESYTVKTTGR